MAWTEIPETVWLETEEDCIKAVEYLLPRCIDKGMGFDLETTGTDKIKDYPLLFSMSDGVQRFAGEAKLLHLDCIKKDLLENPSIPKIGSFIANADMHWLLNIGIKLEGLIMDTVTMAWLVDETRIESGRGYGLKELAWDRLDIKMKDFKEVFPMERGDTAGDAIRRVMADPKQRAGAIGYSGLDAWVAVKLKENLEYELKNTRINNSNTMWDYFINIEAPFTKLMHTMERRGIQISVAHLKQIERPAKKYIEKTNIEFNQKVASLMGREINLRSPADLKELFYKKLGKVAKKWTKTGSESTDKEVLKEWADDGDEYAGELLQYKNITKLYDTYVKGLQECVDTNYRIHTTLRAAGTVSGRLSSSDPNLLNIPRPATDTFKLRKAFISPPGKSLIAADYSQLELVLLAHRSQDPNMIRAIKEGKDLHLFAVSLVFEYDYDEMVKAKKKEKMLGKDSLTEQESMYLQLRQAMKTAGYLIVYGGGPQKLAAGLTREFRSSDPNGRNKQCEYCLEVYEMHDDLCTNCGPEDRVPSRVVERTPWGKLKETNRTAVKGKLNIVKRTVSVSKAAYYISAWFQAFPGVKQWIEYWHGIVERDGEVKTLLGRIRHLPEIYSPNKEDKARAKRQSTNIMQNDAADILRITMLNIEGDEELKQLGAELILQIHDELLLECPEETKDMVRVRVKYLMEKSWELLVGPLNAPLTVEAAAGYSWHDAK
jgi:DNA polymerase I-like protein with 3'-5' exonuclease and polymerase domains